jgi:hypothetical protein
MKKLEEVIQIKGLGMSMKTTLVKRTKKKAMYLRDDMIYEVFRIKVSPPKTMFGKDYPEREVYPGNEDFGSWAWCFSKKTEAEEIYKNL